MAATSFFNGISPSLWYSHILYNQLFGTDFSPAEGITGSIAPQRNWGSSSQDQFKALNGLYNRQYDLLTKAEELSTANTSSIFYQQAAESSDTGTVEVTYFNGENYNGEVPDSTFEFNITQLAQEQINISDAFDPDAASVINTGSQSVTLTVGSTDFTIDFEVSSGADNEAAFQSLVNAINEANTGVTAEIIGGDPTIQIKLVGESGTANAFSLTGQAATATNLNNATQAAQDAQFKVNDIDYTQGNNVVYLLNGKLETNLVSVGQATVTVGQDTTGMVNAIEDLLDSVNSFTAYLAANQYLNPLVSSQWSRMIDNAAQGLERFGVSAASYGQLSLNSTDLTQALIDYPISVREAFGGAGGLVSDIKSFAERVLASPGAALLQRPPSSGYGAMYLRSFTSAPRFRQGSSLFWQVV